MRESAPADDCAAEVHECFVHLGVAFVAGAQAALPGRPRQAGRSGDHAARDLISAQGSDERGLRDPHWRSDWLLRSPRRRLRPERRAERRCAAWDSNPDGRAGTAGLRPSSRPLRTARGRFGPPGAGSRDWLPRTQRYVEPGCQGTVGQTASEDDAVRR